jgi:hypothetical protein
LNNGHDIKHVQLSRRAIRSEEAARVGQFLFIKDEILMQDILILTNVFVLEMMRLTAGATG